MIQLGTTWAKFIASTSSRRWSWKFKLIIHSKPSATYRWSKLGSRNRRWLGALCRFAWWRPTTSLLFHIYTQSTPRTWFRQSDLSGKEQTSCHQNRQPCQRDASCSCVCTTMERNYKTDHRWITEARTCTDRILWNTLDHHQFWISISDPLRRVSGSQLDPHRLRLVLVMPPSPSSKRCKERSTSQSEMDDASRPEIHDMTTTSMTMLITTLVGILIGVSTLLASLIISLIDPTSIQSPSQSRHRPYVFRINPIRFKHFHRSSNTEVLL